MFRLTSRQRERVRGAVHGYARQHPFQTPTDRAPLRAYGETLSDIVSVAIVVAVLLNSLGSAQADGFAVVAMAFALGDLVVQAPVLAVVLLIIDWRRYGQLALFVIAGSTFVLGRAMWRIVPPEHAADFLYAFGGILASRVFAACLTLPRNRDEAVPFASAVPRIATSVLALVPAVIVGMTMAIRNMSFPDPKFMVAIVYYAVHAQLALPAPQRLLAKMGPQE